MTQTVARRRRTARPLDAIPAPPPVLTPKLAERQVRLALVEAGISGQVSRIVTDTGLRPGFIGCVALLHVGADPRNVAAALGKLPEANVQCGEAFVAVYRKAGS